MLHRTRDGVVMDTSEMDASHLKATMALSLNQLREAKDILNGDEKESRFLKAVGEQSESMQEAAEAFVETWKEKFPFYLYEWVLRGNDTAWISAELQEIIGRSSKRKLTGFLRHFNEQTLLTSQDGDMTDPEPDDPNS